MRFSAVVGCDLSLTATGLASSVNGQICARAVVVDTGVLAIALSEDNDLFRIRYIAERVANLTESVGLSSSLVVIEDFSYGSKGRSIYQIGGLQYVVRNTLTGLGVRYVVVAPAALKKFVSGRGNVNKAVVIKSLYKNFGIDEDNDNAADATVLALIGQALIGQRTVERKHEREVIEDLRKKYKTILGE